MNIDNKITLSRVKKAFGVKTLAIVLLITLIAAVLFYITIENKDSKELLIWHITTDAENCFSDEALMLANDCGSKNGIDRILLTKRYPEDRYFDVTMSTAAYYSCDVFIMDAETAVKYSDMNMFLPVDTNRYSTYDMLYIDGKAIGILVNENEYLLINIKTDIDLQIIYDIIDILINN